ncbi:MAG: alginate lyase family protein [Minisyncoccia bacterium]
MKKAFKNPYGALRYVLNYLKGEWLRVKLKIGFLNQSPRVNFLKIKSGVFYIENKVFFEDILNQDFVISCANRVLNNEFGFLGIKPKKIQNLDWFEDIKTGHTWPKEFFLDLKEKLLNDYNKGWDIKNVWELSRFHYLIPLAVAYYKTGEENYLLKWQELISDWIKKNPVYYGPNWLIPMEAAIRVCNWIFSFKIIEKRLLRYSDFVESSYNNKKTNVIASEAKQSLDIFLEQFLASLFEHGRFIFSNLEYGPVRSNHYLSDLVGLIYLGTLFKNLKEGKKWLNFASKAIQKEILYQVYEDGVDYEMSISYHRYKTELFLWAFWLLKLNKVEIQAECLKRLLKMIHFSKSYIKPNSLVPQTGDSDDSRLHLIWEDFYNWEKRNHFALFKLAKYVFEKDFDKEIDNKGIQLLEFKKGGIYIAKSKNFYFITGRNAGCRNKGGSHQHNDILSFELNFNGDDIIIDSGTFVYSPDIFERNKFRSTQKHNVCFIDSQEQNEISKDIFSYFDKNKLKIISVSNKKEEIIIHGVINELERTFTINKKQKSLTIADKIIKEESIIEWNFHLSPEINIWPKKENHNLREIILLGKEDKYLFEAPKDLNFAIIEDEISPSYGVKIPSKTIQFKEKLLKGIKKEFQFKIKPLA